MGKTIKIQEYKLSTDENLKAFGSMAEGFQVHVAGYNATGNRIEARIGSGKETLFVNFCDWNKYPQFTSETLLNKARSIYAAIRLTPEKEKEQIHEFS